MTLVLCGSLTSAAIPAAPPEPLDVEFLDYLASCEGKDDNWTVVANEKERKKSAAPREANPPARIDAPKQEEAKP